MVMGQRSQLLKLQGGMHCLHTAGVLCTWKLARFLQGVQELCQCLFTLTLGGKGVLGSPEWECGGILRDYHRMPFFKYSPIPPYAYKFFMSFLGMLLLPLLPFFGNNSIVYGL